MNEKITANQFCHEMLIATKKHLITHTDFKIGNNPNFLYYVPKLFTTEIEGPNGEDAKVAQAFLILGITSRDTLIIKKMCRLS